MEVTRWGVSMEMVDTRDIGPLAATALANPEEYVGETIEVTGDEYTPESTVEVFTAVTGTELDVYHVSIEVVREEIGEELAMMYEGTTTTDDIQTLESDHILSDIPFS